MAWHRRPTRYRGRKEGFRSGLELDLSSALKKQGAEHRYEAFKIQYVRPARVCHYTPDFILANGIIIEAKGEFDSDDRVKHLLVKEQYPDLDIRFVFSNPNTLMRKGAKTTYAMWCEKHGFQYAAKTVPPAWLKESVRPYFGGFTTKGAIINVRQHREQ